MVMSLQYFESVTLSHQTAFRGQLIIIGAEAFVLYEFMALSLTISQRNTNVATARHRPLDNFVKQNAYVISVVAMVAAVVAAVGISLG